MHGELRRWVADLADRIVHARQHRFEGLSPAQRLGVPPCLNHPALSRDPTLERVEAGMLAVGGGKLHQVEHHVSEGRGDGEQPIQPRTGLLSGAPADRVVEHQHLRQAVEGLHVVVPAVQDLDVSGFRVVCPAAEEVTPREDQVAVVLAQHAGQ